MNEQKQKIISDICPFYKEYGTCEQCNKSLDIDDEPCYWECMANAIINNNYVKQIEGEWKVEEFYNSGLRMHFGTNITCSCCGYTERKGSAFFTPSNFCPNCGAKMKGGAE